MLSGLTQTGASLLLVALLSGSAIAQVAPHATPAGKMAEMDLSSYQGPKGRLAIHAVQGTKGGPNVSGDEVELVLFHNNAPIKRQMPALDDQGLTIANDLPVAMALRPLVRIKHAGVYYQQMGEVLDATKPNASIEVKVYEVTEKRPAWKVTLRQLMYTRKDSGSGADVAETVIVENPDDSSWLGAPADERGRRTTVSLTLPPGASDIQLERGFHGWCCTSFKDSKLEVQMPLMPGQTTYLFAYSVPDSAGSLDLRVSAPVPVETGALYVPQSDGRVEASGLSPAGTELIEGQASALYKAQNLTADAMMGARIAAAPAASRADKANTGGLDWRLAAGGAAILAIGGVVVMVRSMKRG